MHVKYVDAYGVVLSSNEPAYYLRTIKSSKQIIFP